MKFPTYPKPLVAENQIVFDLLQVCDALSDEVLDLQARVLKLEYLTRTFVWICEHCGAPNQCPWLPIQTMAIGPFCGHCKHIPHMETVHHYMVE